MEVGAGERLFDGFRSFSMTSPLLRRRLVRSQQSRARRAEAEGEDVVFDCCGVEVIVPRDQADWSVEALEKFAEGNHVLGLRELVGAQTWQAIKGAGAKRRDLDDLSRDMQEELGVEGN